MFTQEECEHINATFEGTMHGFLGIRVIPSDDDAVWGEMPINERTRQYFGILHGGASLTFAETLAGCGSLSIIGIDNKEKKICGISVTGNHVGMSPTEGKVIAKATIVHAGRTTHVWNVDIYSEDNRLISTERVTNMII